MRYCPATTYTQTPSGGLWNPGGFPLNPLAGRCPSSEDEPHLFYREEQPLGLCSEEDSPALTQEPPSAARAEDQSPDVGATGAPVTEHVSREQRSCPKSAEAQRPGEGLVGSFLSLSFSTFALSVASEDTGNDLCTTGPL